MSRVLIAEDSVPMMKQLRRAIESRDAFKVCAEAHDGQDAVDKFESEKPDVVVMDFNMPRLNGLEAAQEILQRHRNASILMVTVYTSKELENEARNVGIKGFCSKSQIDCIEDALHSLLKGKTYFGHEASVN